MNFEEPSNQGWALPKPILTEPGVKYFLNQALKQSHIIRENFHNTVFNIGMLIFFLLILGAILVYKYKGRLSPIEIEKKNKEKQQYILERIKNFQIAKQRAHQELITGLPHWENEYNIIHSRP
jgi:hypothetical protein